LGSTIFALYLDGIDNYSGPSAAVLHTIAFFVHAGPADHHFGRDAVIIAVTMFLARSIITILFGFGADWWMANF
jgi:hypothetical protein